MPPNGGESTAAAPEGPHSGGGGLDDAVVVGLAQRMGGGDDAPPDLPRIVVGLAPLLEQEAERFMATHKELFRRFDADGYQRRLETGDFNDDGSIFRMHQAHVNYKYLMDAHFNELLGRYRISLEDLHEQLADADASVGEEFLERFRLVDDFVAFASSMRDLCLSASDVVRVYWDVDNTDLPSIEKVDQVLSSIENKSRELAGESTVDYELKLVFNNHTCRQQLLKPELQKKLDNHSVKQQLVPDIREATDRAIDSNIDNDRLVYGSRLQLVGIISKDRGFSAALRRLFQANVRCFVICTDELNEHSPLRVNADPVISGHEARTLLGLVFPPRVAVAVSPQTPPQHRDERPVSTLLGQAENQQPPGPPPTDLPRRPSSLLPEGKYVGKWKSWSDGKGVVEVDMKANDKGLGSESGRLDFKCEVEFTGYVVHMSLKEKRQGRMKVKFSADQSVLINWRYSKTSRKNFVDDVRRPGC